MATLMGELEFFRGDTYPLELTIRNKATKAVIPLSGYSFKMTVDTLENPPDDSTKLFEVTGVLDSEPTTGKVSFTPTVENTNQTIGTYYYDVQMTDPSGHIRTIVKDLFKIVQDITK